MTDIPPSTAESAPTEPPPAVVGNDRYCIRCGYSLAGLLPAGNCPECGTPVELSLRERTLAGASPEYLATLRTGLSLVLNGILLMIVLMVVGMLAGFVLSAGGFGSIQGFQIVLQAVGLLVSAMILLGYWRYTEPDPGQVSLEATHSARSVMRITVAVQAGLAVFNALIASIMLAGVVNPVVAILGGIGAIVGLVLWAVQFFATMRYTRWIATRVPDHYIVRRTKTYLWLLPVLYVPGALLLGLGPLIALVLYWNLLDRLRKHVKSIIATGNPADLRGRCDDSAPIAGMASTHRPQRSEEPAPDVVLRRTTVEERKITIEEAKVRSPE